MWAQVRKELDDECLCQYCLCPSHPAGVSPNIINYCLFSIFSYFRSSSVLLVPRCCTEVIASFSMCQFPLFYLGSFVKLSSFGEEAAPSNKPPPIVVNARSIPFRWKPSPCCWTGMGWKASAGADGTEFFVKAFTTSFLCLSCGGNLAN